MFQAGDVIRKIDDGYTWLQAIGHDGRPTVRLFLDKNMRLLGVDLTAFATDGYTRLVPETPERNPQVAEPLRSVVNAMSEVAE